MQKKNILGYVKSILNNALSPIKDEEYQRRVWFGNGIEHGELSTFIDATIYLISRCKYIFNIPGSAEELGQENYDKLKMLYDLVNQYVDDVELTVDFTVEDIEEDRLLNDPKWHDIQILAEEVYERLEEYVKEKTND